MRKRVSKRLVASTLVLIAVVWSSPRASFGTDRHAGTVLTVDTPAGIVILEEYWVNGRRRELPFRVTSRTRVVLSERNESPRDPPPSRSSSSMRRAGAFGQVRVW